MTLTTSRIVQVSLTSSYDNAFTATRFLKLTLLWNSPQIVVSHNTSNGQGIAWSGAVPFERLFRDEYSAIKF